jgi:putative acetyltransferase
MLIRDERPADAAIIRTIITDAFAPTPHGDGTEAEIVERLRAAGSLTLSLVAEQAGAVVGHVSFSPALIAGEAGPWLQMAPVSVRPDRQRSGIGSALIREGLRRIKAQGTACCLVLGDPGYYGRFGFVSDPELSDHWPHANPHFQRLVLSGAPPRGKVTYHPAFG